MHSVKKPIKKRIKRSSMGVNVSSSILARYKGRTPNHNAYKS